MLQRVWAALGGDPRRAGALTVRRAGPVLSSPLDVEGLLTGAAGAALLAAAELAEVRAGRAPAVGLDVDGLAVAAASERWLRRDGEVVGVAFDPLSAFMPAGDGWVPCTANYGWHREALLRALGDAAAEDVLAAVRPRPALEVEAAVVAAGGCAAALRPAGAWRASAPGRAVGDLVEREAGPPTGRDAHARGAWRRGRAHRRPAAPRAAVAGARRRPRQALARARPADRRRPRGARRGAGGGGRRGHRTPSWRAGRRRPRSRRSRPSPPAPRRGDPVGLERARPVGRPPRLRLARPGRHRHRGDRLQVVAPPGEIGGARLRWPAGAYA